MSFYKLLFAKNFAPLGRRVITSQLRAVSVLHAHTIKSKQLLNPSNMQSPKPIFPAIVPVREYAKSKDKKKEKKNATIEINESQLRDLIDFESIHEKMQKSILQMRQDFIKYLSLRSSSTAIFALPVMIKGVEHELQEVAQITRKSQNILVLNMVAFPNHITDVLKSLQRSGMNLNPQQEGTTIYVPLPKITKEHRENLSKNAKGIFYKYRDAIRDVQNVTIKNVKRQPDISKDNIFIVQTQVTAIADKYIKAAEKLMLAKQNELLNGDT